MSSVGGDQCNVGQLYREVILWLGKRYSKKFDEKFEKKKLAELSDEAILSSTILNILKDVAYTGFNKGGIDIGGVTFKTGELAITGKIIDHLTLKQQGKTTISDITKYGLLKAEGNVEKPIDQTYYFIHLTFQEYLTAYYLKEHLASSDKETAREAASLIATHRNEPKYLMTLKFLSGLVTSEKGQNSQELVTRFWESVTCNVDGVVELGVETKVNLLMHLLGQARSKEEGTVYKIDGRIPNKESLLHLIDVVVLKDLLAWVNQLKETDYISENIKQGLLAGLSDGNLDFNNRKIREIQDKASLGLQAAIGIITKAKTDTTNADKNIIISSCIEIVSNIINKFTTQEQTDVMSKLTSFCTPEYVKQDWHVTKKAIDGITKIAMQVKLTMLTKADVVELIEVLIYNIKDYNYSQAAVKSIAGLLNSIKDQDLTTKTIEQFSDLLVNADTNRDVKVVAIRNTGELVKGIENQQLVESLIDKFSKFFEDTNGNIRKEAIRGTNELVKSIKDPKLVTKLIDKFSKLFENTNNNVRYAVAQEISKLVKSIKNEQLVKNLIDKLIKLFEDNNDIRCEALRGTNELVKSIEDPKLVTKLIDKFIEFFVKNENSNVKRVTTKEISKLVKSIKDTELVKSFIDKFSTLFENTNSISVRCSAVQKTSELVKSIKNEQLVKSLIDKFSELFTDEDVNVRYAVAWETSKLVESIKDPELVKNLIEKFSELFTDKDSDVRKEAIRETSKLVKSIKDPELVKNLIEKFSELFTDKDSDVRKEAIRETSKLVKSIKDPELVKNLIEKFSELFENTNSDVRAAVVQETSELVKSIEDPKLAIKLVNEMRKFFEDADSNVRKEAVRGTSELVKSIKDPELAKSLIDKFSGLFTDKDSDVRAAVVQDTSKLLKSIEDKELVSSLIDKFSELFKNTNSDVRKEAVRGTSELVKSIKDPELVKNLIEKFSELFTDKDSDVRKEALVGIAVMSGNLLLPRKEFIQYLNHHNKVIREGVENTLVKSFKAFLKKFELLEELVEYGQNLTIHIIVEKPYFYNFDNPFLNLGDQISEKQILEDLHNLATSSGDKDTKDRNLIDLKYQYNKLLNKIGNIKNHELIKFALLVIGKEYVSAENSIKQKLVELAKKVINYQIEHLSDEGLKWINDNFEDLVSLSKESKIFIKKLYHKILEDLMITELGKELIIKFINQGMTTSLTKTGEIIFEGKKCAITGDNKELILEEIARAVIDQKQDMLAVQYREHTPLFKNTGSSLDVAAADISAESIIDDGFGLQHNAWRLSLMYFSDHKKSFPTKVFLLLEGRNAFGNLVIYKIPSDGPNKLDYFVKYPSYVDVNTEFCESIFEKMEYTDLIKPRYYVSSFDVSYDQSQTLLDKINSHLKPKDSSDMVAVRKSLIELLEEIIDSGIYKVISTVAWDEYKDLKTINKVQVLHIKDEGKVALIKQESFRIDDAEKTAQKLKVHGKAIVDIKTTLNLLESVTNTMQKQVDESAMTKKDRDGMEEAIKSLDQSVKNIASKVSDQDPIMQQITEELTELLQRKEVDTTTFLNLRKKIKVIEDQLKEGTVTVQMLDKVVYDNPLLNNLELMKDATKLLGMNFNELLNLSKGLSQGLITEAIENNDPAIILGGLISLAGTNEYIEIYSYY